jgi:hypothetical protein
MNNPEPPPTQDEIRLLGMLSAHFCPGKSRELGDDIELIPTIRQYVWQSIEPYVKDNELLRKELNMVYQKLIRAESDLDLSKQNH